MTPSPSPTSERAELIRVRGLVQGVGLRPTVWRLAQSLALRGWVANDGAGVSIYACGAARAIDDLVERLPRSLPPLARLDGIERVAAAGDPQVGDGFVIAGSAASSVHTGIVPDAATCPACVAEILDPSARRFRYPFTNCTHCGPRLTIVEHIPYDRDRTTMAPFEMCPACATEYHDPTDRRFHAQPIACPTCGPRLRLERADGKPVATEAYTALDAADAAGALLQKGFVVAIKGLGGFQLACDATDEEAVARLRRGKRREGKPFALMARDLAVVRTCCEVDAPAEAALTSPQAPIVILPARPGTPIAPSVAPGVGTLGVMLPNTPMHHLLLRRMTRPIVLTSGNRSDEPQAIDASDARTRLGAIADFLLTHDRAIVQRVDDSVVRVMAGAPRVLRRARGYAPAPLALPPGFEAAPPVLAFGAELKNTFCLLRDGAATLSHHMGDLENAATLADYRRALARYLELFELAPQVLAIDRHPEYLSSKIGRTMADERGLELVQCQHHHAHIAACLAENGVALKGGPVLGVALDGLGFGETSSQDADCAAGPQDRAGLDARGQPALWGGEFLLADYRGYRRVGTFKPVAMLGGSQAMHEPWRNTYAHLMAGIGWPRFKTDYGELELCRFFERKDRAALDRMLARNVNSPPASSCGRLFDAVAAAVGVCREHARYEGQGAVGLEALVDRGALADEDELLAYPFAILQLHPSGLPYVEPLAMWRALLGDLVLGTPPGVIAARFHRGLAGAIAAMVSSVGASRVATAPVTTVALSGGVFQNRVLLELVVARLEQGGFTVLTHRRVPPNDGGLALGQAVIAAARSIEP